MTTTQKQADFIPANRRISVCAKRFYAALQFASTEETRYYLNGVFIEPHKDGGVVMVATDGHCLAAVRDKSAYITGQGGWICGLPKQPFNTALKRKESGTLHFAGRSAYLTHSVLGADALAPEFDPTIITEQHMAVAYANPIDGTFPEWRKVLPDQVVEPSGTFVMNALLVDRFGKATRALRPDADKKKSWSNKPIVPLVYFAPPDEKSPIVIRVDGVPDFYGVQMPIRKLDDFEQNPDWLGAPETKAKPKPANDAKPENVPDTGAA